MLLNFYKYQGTGNDFVIIDNRNQVFPKDNNGLVSFLCDRKFGIGADGLILLEDDDVADFKMVYYNSDGNQSSMCGNGGRCIVAFAKHLGLVVSDASFEAVDGHHKARIEADVVSLQMQEVTDINEKSNSLFLNTGSPHHVQLVTDLKDFDVRKEGERLRYGVYGQEGSNINFVENIDENSFLVRTYERGVEDETLSCGTGVTAVALAMHHSGQANSNTIKITTPGGLLEVRFTKNKNKEGYNEIWLTGAAQLVFKGEIYVEA
ncbi:Diaminopimelate epimerase [Arenibacter antarcticus]|uniref:Diaminopimelate epimerase n=1 Tax=Arenibacter antarcticus TaxID=2040469 RepID=A0ABW5VF52_9FLAO|nr:diaminopimelate epimerase [Arenibacter sp. H213]MCM4169778.1 diaminopimelate epimerase [Arenibacter sp. H213]